MHLIGQYHVFKQARTEEGRWVANVGVRVLGGLGPAARETWADRPALRLFEEPGIHDP